MQSSIYYSEDDTYLIGKLEEKAMRERKSMSACLLSILEEYFESGNRLGEILSDMGLVDRNQLNACLDKQEKEQTTKKIGEILVEENHVRDIDIDRALIIQQLSWEDNNDDSNLK